MDYKKDVLEEAYDFLCDEKDVITEGIIEDQDFDDLDLRDIFHEQVIDRAYTPEDALYIIRNCENEETDKGLWQGQEWDDMLSTKATFSYGMDVWFKCEEMYDGLKDQYMDRVDEDEKKNEDEEEYEPDALSIINEVWDKFQEEYTIQPVEKGGEEERNLLIEWMRLNSYAGLWGGYPVGGSYIDARSGSGHGMPDIKEFVDFDHEIASKLPHMRGKYKKAVQERIEELDKLHKK